MTLRRISTMLTSTVFGVLFLLPILKLCSSTENIVGQKQPPLLDEFKVLKKDQYPKPLDYIATGGAKNRYSPLEYGAQYQLYTGTYWQNQFQQWKDHKENNDNIGVHGYEHGGVEEEDSPYKEDYNTFRPLHQPSYGPQRKSKMKYKPEQNNEARYPKLMQILKSKNNKLYHMQTPSSGLAHKPISKEKHIKPEQNSAPFPKNLIPHDNDNEPYQMPNNLESVPVNEASPTKENYKSYLITNIYPDDIKMNDHDYDLYQNSDKISPKKENPKPEKFMLPYPNYIQTYNNGYAKDNGPKPQYMAILIPENPNVVLIDDINQMGGNTKYKPEYKKISKDNIAKSKQDSDYVPEYLESDYGYDLYQRPRNAKYKPANKIIPKKNNPNQDQGLVLVPEYYLILIPYINDNNHPYETFGNAKNKPGYKPGPKEKNTEQEKFFISVPENLEPYLINDEYSPYKRPRNAKNKPGEKIITKPDVKELFVPEYIQPHYYYDLYQMPGNAKYKPADKLRPKENNAKLKHDLGFVLQYLEPDYDPYLWPGNSKYKPTDKVSPKENNAKPNHDPDFVPEYLDPDYDPHLWHRNSKYKPADKLRPKENNAKLKHDPSFVPEYLEPDYDPHLWRGNSKYKPAYKLRPKENNAKPKHDPSFVPEYLEPAYDPYLWPGNSKYKPANILSPKKNNFKSERGWGLGPEYLQPDYDFDPYQRPGNVKYKPADKISHKKNSAKPEKYSVIIPEFLEPYVIENEYNQYELPGNAKYKPNDENISKDSKANPEQDLFSVPQHPEQYVINNDYDPYQWPWNTKHKPADKIIPKKNNTKPGEEPLFVPEYLEPDYHYDPYQMPGNAKYKPVDKVSSKNNIKPDEEPLFVPEYLEPDYHSDPYQRPGNAKYKPVDKIGPKNNNTTPEKNSIIVPEYHGLYVIEYEYNPYEQPGNTKYKPEDKNISKDNIKPKQDLAFLLEHPEQYVTINDYAPYQWPWITKYKPADKINPKKNNTMPDVPEYLQPYYDYDPYQSPGNANKIIAKKNNAIGKPKQVSGFVPEYLKPEIDYEPYLWPKNAKYLPADISPKKNNINSDEPVFVPEYLEPDYHYDPYQSPGNAKYKPTDKIIPKKNNTMPEKNSVIITEYLEPYVIEHNPHEQPENAKYKPEDKKISKENNGKPDDNFSFVPEYLQPHGNGNNYDPYEWPENTKYKTEENIIPKENIVKLENSIFVPEHLEPYANDNHYNPFQKEKKSKYEPASSEEYNANPHEIFISFPNYIKPYLKDNYLYPYQWPGNAKYKPTDEINPEKKTFILEQEHHQENKPSLYPYLETENEHTGALNDDPIYRPEEESSSEIVNINPEYNPIFSHLNDNRKPQYPLYIQQDPTGYSQKYILNNKPDNKSKNKGNPVEIYFIAYIPETYSGEQPIHYQYKKFYNGFQDIQKSNKFMRDIYNNYQNVKPNVIPEVNKLHTINKFEYHKNKNTVDVVTEKKPIYRDQFGELSTTRSETTYNKQYRLSQNPQERNLQNDDRQRTVNIVNSIKSTVERSNNLRMLKNNPLLNKLKYRKLLSYLISEPYEEYLFDGRLKVPVGAYEKLKKALLARNFKITLTSNKGGTKEFISSVFPSLTKLGMVEHYDLHLKNFLKTIGISKQKYFQIFFYVVEHPIYSATEEGRKEIDKIAQLKPGTFLKLQNYLKKQENLNRISKFYDQILQMKVKQTLPARKQKEGTNKNKLQDWVNKMGILK